METGLLRPELTPLSTKSFGPCVGVSQAILLALFAVFAKVDPKVSDDQFYNLYLGITIMLFVGFGYLMTFLRWYGLGAAGLTMFITCFGIECALLAEPLFGDWFSKRVDVDYQALINADFAVAAFLISFGGLIGKINPTQIWVLVVLESVFYSANKRLVLIKWLDIQDCGGTIIIHMFGAYFGLAASWILGKPRLTDKEKSSTTTDVLALVGTVFLWIYWPSFVSGSLKPGSLGAQRAIINTVMALLGATVVTFALSPAFGGRLDPVHVQNSTLAGGVAIGATANLPLGPFGACLLGTFAGAVSVAGYAKITPYLEDKLGLHDTCGIHNLHGMPSIIGGLASAIVPAWIAAAGAPKFQLLGVVCTLAISSVSGAFTGKIMSLFKDDDDTPMADDSLYWEVADDFAKDSFSVQ